jgi:hypothetical protein
MKVTFTAKEYARVLELVHLGLHVVTGYQGKETAAAQRYAETVQKLLELATPLGCADLVEAGSDGALALAPKLTEDERVEKVISEFANDVFWHELVARLADRDCSSEQARRLLESATPGVDPPPAIEDRVKEIEDRYWAEFQKFDLNHVVVLKGGRG